MPQSHSIGLSPSVPPRPGARSSCLRCAVVVALAAAGLTLLGRPASRALADSLGSAVYTPTNSNELMAYARVVRLQYSGSANGTLLATFEHWTSDNSFSSTTSGFKIQQSTNNGASWTTIATIQDGETGTGHPWPTYWQPALFEFPRQLGAYPAGTLLLVGNVANSGSPTQTHFQEWRSTDHGAHWTFVGVIQTGGAVSGGNGGGTGIWEPDLQVDANGNLLCYFSDERQTNTYSQFLGHIVSTDGGVTWSANLDGSTRVAPGEVKDVASSVQSDRPGMATVITLPGGSYLMSFEVCGPTYNCEVHLKSSSNGDTFGTGPADLGTRPQTSDGIYLHSSPFIAWSPQGGPNGEILLDGDTAAYTNGSGAPESRRMILVNTNATLGTGSWSWIPAPFAVVGGSCNSANYSPTLLPSSSGTSVLLMTENGTGVNGACLPSAAASSSGILPFYTPLAGGSDVGWDDYGGSWSVSNGVYSDSTSGAGDKGVTGSTGWGDYTLQGDVQLTAAGQAGLIVRVSNPSTGADAYNGYYIGVETAGHVFLGREDGAWHPLYYSAMSVATNTWYHLTVQAVGCTFTVSALPVGSTATPTSFSYTDSGCSFTTGAVGVRDYYTTAAWRNISVTPGGTTSTSVLPYEAPFAGGSSSGWTTYGGSWSVNATNETYSDASSGPGDKSVYGSTAWSNYTLQADVQINASGQAGLIARVTNPGVGADALDGYYLGIESQGDVFVGREDGAWHFLGNATIPGGVSINTWYHVTFQVVGSTLTATAQNITSPDSVSFAVTDGTFGSGAIGVRDHYTPSTWRNVMMTPR